MKKIFYLPLISLAIILGSCERYLDIKVESRQAFITTAEDCQLVLDDYSTMNVGYPYDGEASADDYYISNNYDLVGNQDDRGVYTWSNSVVRTYSTDPNKDQWTPVYFKIYNTNLVLEALEKLEGGGTDQAILNQLRGSALFFRSYCYWQLAQLYAKPYTASTAGNDPGIPLRSSSDINEKSARGTVKETYERITQDLQEAASLLPVSNTSVASRPSRAAAYAMLARVYLSMEDYPQAQLNADEALKLKSSLLDYNTLTPAQLSSNTPFNPRFNKEVIFQAVMKQSNLINPSSPFFNYAKINSELVSSYATNDLRSRVFIKAVSGGGYLFSGNYEPTINGTFFNGLAVDEVYLTRAECYARAGNAAAAMADLNTLLRARWITGTYTDMTAVDATDALTKVLIERRKELLMRGLRWTDLRRLNRDPRFKRDLSRTAGSDPTVYNLPANDLRYVLLIPSEEIERSGLVQNPRN